MVELELLAFEPRPLPAALGPEAFSQLNRLDLAHKATAVAREEGRDDLNHGVPDFQVLVECCSRLIPRAKGMKSTPVFFAHCPVAGANKGKSADGFAGLMLAVFRVR